MKQDCEYSFITNKCVEDIRPALKAQCKEWDVCRKRNPQDGVTWSGVVARYVGDILNKFTGSLDWKSWVLISGLLILMVSILGQRNIPVNQVTSPEVYRQRQTES